MSNNSELDLLVDIAKLLKKYGPSTFETLSTTLSSPDFLNKLSLLLSKSASAARTSGLNSAQDRKEKNQKTTFRSSLLSLHEIEPEKSTILVQLYDDLMAKTVLPTLRDLQAFASDMGLPSIKAAARDKAVVPFLKSLMLLDTNQLKSIIAGMKKVNSEDDRSLEGWSNIILDKHRGANESR